MLILVTKLGLDKLVLLVFELDLGGEVDDTATEALAAGAAAGAAGAADEWATVTALAFLRDTLAFEALTSVLFRSVACEFRFSSWNVVVMNSAPFSTRRERY
jgi:hypothetical protein